MASCTLSLKHAGDLSIAPSAGAANVTYYIQAERVLHDFAPGGVVDQCTGLPLEGETSVRATPCLSSYPSIRAQASDAAPVYMTLASTMLHLHKPAGGFRPMVQLMRQVRTIVILRD